MQDVCVSLENVSQWDLIGGVDNVKAFNFLRIRSIRFDL